MISRSMLRAMLAVLMALLALPQAFAQSGQYARDVLNTPVIRGFNVEEVRQLGPGTQLNFELYGTPGGIATLYIDGGNRNLRLSEVESGVYAGSYTIGSRERIGNNSRVTANLRVGNRVATSVLTDALAWGRPTRPAPAGGEPKVAPRLDRFLVQGTPGLRPGDELRFIAYGTPGARVDMAIAGARGVYFMPEQRPGEYMTVYTIRRNERIGPDSRAAATIRQNGRQSTMPLGQPLLAALMQSAQPGQPGVTRYCTNCATVEAVNLVDVSGDGSYLGTIGGAVIGGMLGSQVGDGSGRTAAQVAGAVAGAIVGRNVERNMRSGQRRFEVVVRYLNSGATETLQFENDPGFRVGDRVRVNNGVITLDR